MGYMVRRDPTGPNRTVFRVGVMDGDRVVRPATDPEPDPEPGPPDEPCGRRQHYDRRSVANQQAPDGAANAQHHAEPVAAGLVELGIEEKSVQIVGGFILGDARQQKATSAGLPACRLPHGARADLILSGPTTP